MLYKEKVSLKVSDGSQMDAYVARPDDAGKHPGILVFQEAFGVNAYIRDVTERFAKEGYIAIAPELFHRTHPGFDGSYTNFDRAPMAGLTDDNLEIDTRAIFKWLKSQPQLDGDKIASVGFCMGGRVSYLANSILPLKAAISFYGGNIAPRLAEAGGGGPSLLNRAKDLHAPMLFFWGGLDAHISSDQIKAVTDTLDSAKKEYKSIVYPKADHGFFCDQRASYNQEASLQAWPLTLKFLKTHLQ